MKTRAIIIIWLILIGLFAGYGFFGPGYQDQLHAEPFDFKVAFSSTMVYGGIGFTLATCLAISLYAVGKVRAKSVTGFRAILFVLLCSAIAAFIPPFVMARSGLYGGERALAIAYVGGFTIGISLIAFVIFDIAVLVVCIRRH